MFIYFFTYFPWENCGNDLIHYQAVFAPFVGGSAQTHDCVAP